MDKKQHIIAVWTTTPNLACLFSREGKNLDFYVKYPNFSTSAGLFKKLHEAQLNSLWAVFRPVGTGWKILAYRDLP